MSSSMQTWRRARRLPVMSLLVMREQISPARSMENIVLRPVLAFVAATGGAISGTHALGAGAGAPELSMGGSMGTLGSVTGSPRARASARSAAALTASDGGLRFERPFDSPPLAI